MVEFCLAVTGTLKCAVVRLRANAIHMPAWVGEVNPGTDRDFAGKFTVASFVHGSGENFNAASPGLFQLASEFRSLAKRPEEPYFVPRDGFRQKKRNC